MSIKAIRILVTTLIVALVSNVFAGGVQLSANAKYDFDYVVTGEGRSRPTKVFNDGEGGVTVRPLAPVLR